jgi:hypothetical protein
LNRNIWWGVAAAVVMALPAGADARPAFLPLRDVAVRYQLTVPGRLSAEYQLAYRAAGQLARVDDPAHGLYFLVDLPAGHAALVVPMLRSVVDTPDFSGLTQEIDDAGGARFTPLGHGEYAGLGCENFLVLSRQGTATACITRDGVTLRFHGSDAQGSATVTALSVTYGPQPAGAFAVPDGYGRISLPPQALAQLLAP